MKSLPKISIVIPSYNKVQYIQETLESIISQKYSNLEVIIQDGGSTDGTLEIIKKYAKEHPKVIRWISKKDKGQVDAINKGFKKARGEILAFINADDVYVKGALQKIGIAFSKCPETVWAAGQGETINKKGKTVFSLVGFYKNVLLRFNKYTFLIMVNYLMQPSVFLKKEMFNKYGPLVGWKGMVLEYELWLKIGKDVMPKIISHKLSKFRLTREALSFTQLDKISEEEYKIVKKHTNNPFIVLLHKLHNAGRRMVGRFYERT